MTPNSQDKRRRPRLRIELRIGVPVLLMLLVVTLLAPQIQAAREVARKTQCTNTMYQHSGSHPSAIVTIHQDGSVTAHCCPTCFTRAAPVHYVDSTGKALNAAELSDLVIKAGNTAIWRFQMTPRYKSLRHLSVDADEARAE